MSLAALLKESIRMVPLKPLLPLVAFMPLSFFSLLRADANHLAGPAQRLWWLSAVKQLGNQDCHLLIANARLLFACKA